MSEVETIFAEIHKKRHDSLDSVVDFVRKSSAREIDDDGNLPLHKACERGSYGYNLLKKLVRIHPKGLKCVNVDGYLPIHLLLSKHDECNWKYTWGSWINQSDEFMECLKLCVDGYVESLLVDGPGLKLPLHFAASNEALSVDTLKFLIAPCPKSIEQNDENNDLPLHLAAAANATHLVEFLIQQYPEAANALNNTGNLPLHLAVSNGDSNRVILLLLQQYPGAVGVRNKNGNLPLHLAAREGREALVSLFLEKHPKGAKVQNKYGQLPIHCAAYAKRITICRILGEKFPETLRAPSDLGYLPLHCAASGWSCGASLCKELIEMYPEAVEVPTKNGNLPLHLAADLDKPEVFRILIKNYPAGATIQNKSGRFPCNLTKSLPIMADIRDSCPISFRAAHQTHMCDHIFSYLKHECPRIGKKRLRHIEEMFQCASYSDLHDGMITELEEKENDIVRLRVQLENHRKQATVVAAEHRDIYDRQAKMITDMKSNQALDTITIASLRDSLKNEQNQHKQTKAREKELGERLQNPERTEQSAQNAIATSNFTDSYYEARKSELCFLSKVDKMKECLDVDDLKAVLLSLNSRLAGLKEKHQPGSKLSKTQKYVKCLFSLCAKGEDMERDDICEVILDINKELLEVEGIDNASATANHPGTDAPALDIKREDDPMTETPISSSRKRSRANISPSSSLN